MMTAEQWRRIENLIETAQQLSTAEQHDFLSALRGEDPVLFQEVDALLKALEQVSDFLETPPTSLTRRPQAPAHAELEPGQLVGAYRIERLIGRGGMGSVYLAARADDAFQKKVAVKLVNHEMLNRTSVRRFQLERQILANLEHPNIARLLDGGTTAEGLPFLVMEVVDGLPIDEYCDRHALPIPARIELFLSVCRGVQHAHQKLLVHRDLKPKNILVDGDGVPKLLDFGVAKMLEPQASPVSFETTRTWARPLTPDYASPEQLRGTRITTATDVYALGVVLYQLLTGHLPFRFTTLNMDEIERMLGQEEPAKPSAVVAQLASETISKSRKTSTRRLRSQLAGDLDNIVLMALRKDPQRRYVSVEQLIEDLRRHNEGLPVLARQKALGYRFGKLLRRHRLAFGFAVILLLIGIGFLLNTVRHAGILAGERDRAEAERIKAEQVADFLVDILQEADPAVALGESYTVQEALLRGSRKLPGELPDQPEIRVKLLHTMGMIYLNLGHFDEAQDLLAQSLELQRHLAAASPEQLAATLTGLGRCYAEKGAYDVATAIHREACLIARSIWGEQHPKVAGCIFFLGQAQYLDGKLDEAKEQVGKALATQRLLLAPDHPEIARSLDLLSYLATETGAFEDAENLLREALEIRRGARADHQPDIARTLSSLAGLRNEQGYGEEAAELYRQALSIRQEIYAPEHPLIAESLNNLANALAQTGELEEAIRLARRALGILERLHGEHHRYVITAMHNLGDFLRRQGDTREAEAILRRALELLPEALPENHPGKMYLSSVLGRTLLDAGKPGQAEPFLRTALEMRRAIYPPGHAQIAGAQTSLGRCLTALGRLRDAEALLTESLAMLEASPQQEPHIQAHIRETLRRLAELYERWDRPRVADKYLQQLQL